MLFFLFSAVGFCGDTPLKNLKDPALSSLSSSLVEKKNLSSDMRIAVAAIDFFSRLAKTDREVIFRAIEAIADMRQQVICAELQRDYAMYAMERPKPSEPQPTIV